MPTGSHSLEIGEEAPLLSTISSSSKDLSSLSLEGKYVLVNFWSAADPMSRIANKNFSELTATLPSSQIAYVSVCTDDDLTLQNEIMRIDGIHPSVISLSASDLSAEVLDDYQISRGHRSFLINPFGNLEAIAPDRDKILSVTV